MTLNHSENPEFPSFWAKRWARKRDESPFTVSQKASPDRWRRFYDGMTEADAAIWRDTGDFGETVCALLLREGVVASGETVLDMGCGFGTLALPLAAAGAHVLAVDNSPGMLGLLKVRSEEKTRSALMIRLCDFETFSSGPEFDLATAACFPPVLSPESISRLEKWSRRHVAVVIGTGTETFPFRRDLWMAIMGDSLPSGRFHFIHFMGWLAASGRRPNLQHVRFPLRLDHAAADMTAFYTRYFGIFGKTESETHERIARYFENIAVNDRIQAHGRGEVAVLWWRAVHDGEAS